MTKQNRVDPWGQLNAIPAKGSWLGNRGILHNDQQNVIVQWRHKSWVTCQLSFNDIKRDIFSAGHYSELFFLDEATALAAGHRPCAECRRQRYKEFKSLWCEANLNESLSSNVPIKAIDERLHAERVTTDRKKASFQTELGSLPPGALVDIDGEAYLYWAGRLHLWSHEGYSQTKIKTSPLLRANVLTPFSSCKLILRNPNTITLRS